MRSRVGVLLLGVGAARTQGVLLWGVALRMQERVCLQGGGVRIWGPLLLGGEAWDTKG